MGLYGNLASFSLSRFLDRHFGFLWGFPLTTRSQTSVPRSPLPAPRSPLPVPRFSNIPRTRYEDLTETGS